MRLHRRAAAPAIACAVLGAVALLAPAGAAAASTASVSIADSPPDSACGSNAHCFDPATVHVDPGGTVTWTSQSGVPHTVTADDGSWSSSSSGMAFGQSYARTFPTAGTFSYHCNFHTYMHGTVVVGSGAPPSTQPPPTKAPATQAPTAAPTVRAATTQAPTAAATATPAPTAAPVAQAPAVSAPSPSAQPSPTDPAAGVVATTPTGSEGGGAGPVVAVVLAFIVLAGLGAWWARRRRSVFTKIH